MNRMFQLFLLLFTIDSSMAQTSSVIGAQVPRPKLVVGVVVDQMRWDFLYRYYDRYSASGGFRRILNEGHSCENTYIPYSPTVTGPGHATIYTGATPSVHGIAGNAWWDRELGADIYCTEDKTVTTVGSTSTLGLQSPRNMISSTIGDEIRLATNFQGKVIGIAIKDRGGILPAGHSANAAYWYDNTNGQWITSNYYMNDVPQWVKNFESKKMIDKYYEEGWKTLYPINTYTQSTSDDKPYELKGMGTGFPYDFKKYIGKSYSAVSSTPFGNTLTFEMSKAAINGENLGGDAMTDVLAISLSSPDYIGHTWGPNSIEQEDNFLRLDKDLGDFLNFLDSKIGKGAYLFFLSADHGAAHIPGFLKENKIPAGSFNVLAMEEQMNQQLKDKYGVGDIIISTYNYQVTLNDKVVDANKLNRQEIIKWIVEFLAKQPAVARAIPSMELLTTPINSKIREMLVNGYFPKRGGDVHFILKPGWIEGFSAGGTTHGVWNPYDSHIPLVWYGWGIKPGRTNRETYMTDIAPTIAAMLRVQMPNGCVGKVITEVIR